MVSSFDSPGLALLIAQLARPDQSLLAQRNKNVIRQVIFHPTHHDANPENSNGQTVLLTLAMK
jgi:hypothetical protein